MRKEQKQQAESFLKTLGQAHEGLRRLLAKKENKRAALAILEDCQQGAIEIGNMIEESEGADFAAIPMIEEYCELLYQIHRRLTDNENINANAAYKSLRSLLIRIENRVRHDIKVKIEAVFLPYKSSMWDSLESVWRAADEDSNCDAYVIPIPYYDKNPDGSFRKMHYEAELYPSYVPITRYDEFDFGKHRPDVIFIHNPYDAANYVTSVHPFFYSDNLKKYTACLIYIPYYATSGGMSDGQAICPAYLYADYIVIQSEKYRKYFDARIPGEKFLAMGSPKFDSVIRKCQNPPAPPKEWAVKMRDRRVYFYNTTIGEALWDTGAFLKKMRYVFDLFREREDACLLWRPHPLLESTFDSMRASYKSEYDALKNEFIDEDLGIYDDTPEIESTIANADAYIGDAGSSVTSLFGVAGKPLFILNDRIHTLPDKDDWRGEKLNLTFDTRGNDRYFIARNNQLWFSEKNDYHYSFYMDLGCEYSGGRYYLKALEFQDKIFVLPGNAQHLLVIRDKKIKKIPFIEKTTQSGAFGGYWYNEKYLFLLPFRYPFLVRVTVETEEIRYVDGVCPFNVRYDGGEWRSGGVWQYGEELVFASPSDNEFLFLNMDTLEARKQSSHSKCNLGTQEIVGDGEDLWLLPLNGMTVTRWNPATESVREYDGALPDGFQSIRGPYDLECRERPFGAIAFSGEGGSEKIVISPTWGNMYLSLDRKTGEMKEWKPPIPFANRGKNGYFTASGMGGFITLFPNCRDAKKRIWYAPERKLYEIDIETKEYREIETGFDYEELKAREPGFDMESEWLQYCLNENAFNSLKDFLDGQITGKRFDREKQIAAFAKINANTDGTCGRAVYEFARGKVL